MVITKKTAQTRIVRMKLNAFLNMCERSVLPIDLPAIEIKHMCMTI